MKKIKIGVMGVYRGSSMINYCRIAKDAEIVAICDKWEEGLARQKAQNEGLPITYYTSFDEFIKHDMDAVVLANYANEHAPFAIRAMREGKHVFSEVLPVQTMAEAVALCEAVEETGMIYAYGENYCYMPAVYEMKRLYEAGVLGEFEYAEGEYIHNCEPIWPSITYGDPNHWRNNQYALFYCTHSFGPIVHITGRRPVRVVGFEGKQTERELRMGAKAGSFGIEMVTFDNGAIAKSIHGGLYKNSVWYSLYGSKGRAETAREDGKAGDVGRIYLNVDGYSGEYGGEKLKSYCPNEGDPEEIRRFGHGGSDYYSLHHFVKRLRGDADADIIDVYEALDSFLPGLLGYRSVLQGGIPIDIPNMRDKEAREAYRNDHACTDARVAGDQLIPVYSKGNPEIDPAVYAHMRELFEADLHSSTGYAARSFSQNMKKS